MSQGTYKPSPKTHSTNLVLLRRLIALGLTALGLNKAYVCLKKAFSKVYWSFWGFETSWPQGYFIVFTS